MEFSINDSKFSAYSLHINLPYAQGCLTVYQLTVTKLNLINFILTAYFETSSDLKLKIYVTIGKGLKKSFISFFTDLCSSTRLEMAKCQS